MSGSSFHEAAADGNRVSGLPITLTRNYDSRNTDSRDFGAGWNLDVNSERLEKSGVMGEGWGGSQGTDPIGRALADIMEKNAHHERRVSQGESASVSSGSLD